MLFAGTVEGTLSAVPGTTEQKLQSLPYTYRGVETAQGEGSEHAYVVLAADFFRDGTRRA